MRITTKCPTCGANYLESPDGCTRCNIGASMNRYRIELPPSGPTEPNDLFKALGIRSPLQ